MKITAKEARNLDWSKFPSSMPLEGIVRPNGERKAELVERIRRAFARLESK